MTFNEFQNFVSNIENKPLGGLDAQFKLAPKLRLKYSLEKIKASNPKQAAVLALFYPDEKNNTRFLLTQRASYNGKHSAQISFPGGKIEKSDQTKQNTALRESREEVGVKEAEVTIIKEMTEVYIPPSNFLVTPYVGYLDSRPQFVPNHEVSEIIEVPLKALLDDANIREIPITTSYMEKSMVPCFYFEQHIVWGATAMMLAEIRDLF